MDPTQALYLDLELPSAQRQLGGVPNVGMDINKMLTIH
jgi:hypothetical protein